MWMGMLHIIVAVIIDRLRSCKISGNTMELEMTREDVFEQLTAVFRDVFDSDDIVLKGYCIVIFRIGTVLRPHKYCCGCHGNI